jgi:hypothetical protein
MAHTLPFRAPVGSLLKGDRKPRKQARRVLDDSHRRFIASLPCIVSGVEGRTQAAHLRFASSSYGKPITGGSTKADDCWLLPLSVEMHDEQHRAGNEIAWWLSKGVADPLKLCLRLYSVSGDEVSARRILLSLKQIVEG